MTKAILKIIFVLPLKAKGCVGKVVAKILNQNKTKKKLTKKVWRTTRKKLYCRNRNSCLDMFYKKDQHFYRTLPAAASAASITSNWTPVLTGTVSFTFTLLDNVKFTINDVKCYILRE